MKRCVSVIMAGFTSYAVCAAERLWQAAGDGDWSEPANWVDGILPGASDTAVFNTALSADAVVTMDGSAPLVGAIKVDNADNVFTRAFEGAQAVRSNEFVKGRAELRGIWTSTHKAITGVGSAAGQTAWLDLTGEAVFSATNQHALYVGTANNARGRVTVKDQARLSLSAVDTDFGISPGRNTGSVGSIVQEGGLVESTGRFLPGYSGYGAYELLGGGLRLPYGAGNTRYRLAVQSNSTGLFYQRGGDLLVATNGLSVGYHFEIGSGNNNAEAVYYTDGGTARFETQLRLLSGGSSVNPCYAELTVADDAVVEAGSTVYLRSPETTLGGRTAVNLNRGGTLRAPALLQGKSGVSGLNGDGGTLELMRSSEYATLFEGLHAVTLFEGGLGLRFPGPSGAVMTGTLRGPGGWGVASVTLTAGGSGYLAPPRVVLTGGSGSNATAVALIDHASGAVTGAVVTCRGEGYDESDVLTVSITGGGGSGCTGVAALSENRAGPLVKSGAPRLVIYSQPDFDGEYEVREGLFLHSSRNAGSPHVRGIRVSGPGAVFQNGSGTAFDNTPEKWDLVNPLATLTLGGDWGGGEVIVPCGAEETVYQQHYSALEVAFGRSRLTTTGYTPTNGAALIFGTITRRPGGALAVTTTTNLNVTVSGDPAGFAFGAVRPVVPAASVGVTTELATLDAEGRIVSLSDYDEGFGTESNLYLTASAIADGFAVNSVRLDDGKVLTLQEGGTTVVGSGVVLARAGTGGFTTLSGGTLTSGNGTDLILTDFHNAIERRNVSNGKSGLVADTRLTDNGTTPVALFALGRTWDPAAMSIATGPAVELTRTDNTYSGGTYILDTALAVADDGSLGAVPAHPTNAIFTSGMAMLRAPATSATVTLHRNRSIRVCDGGLTFFGDTGSQAGRVLFDVAGDISGKGVLVMNHWSGSNIRSVVLLGGDNRGFAGSVAVHGMLRLGMADSLPARAGLLLCDVSSTDSAGGVLETSGTFTRTPGTGPGQVWWGRVTEVAPGYVASLSTPASGGGFSAYGGDLTINLGGDRRKLVLGEIGFAPQRLRLQDDEATDVLYWENPVDVTNGTLTVQVAYQVSGKRAVWRGAVTSSSTDGGGAFAKRGAGRLVLADGADFGPLSFTANNTVELDVTNRQELACHMSGSALWLEKYGAGVTVLSGSNTYENATRIYEGTLLVNGTNAAGGSFTVSAGATLGGAGVAAPKAGASVTVDGTLAAGGEALVCATLTLGNTEQATALALNGTLAAEIGMESHDLVTVLGDVSFGEGASVTVTALDEQVWLARRGEEIPLLTWTGTKTGTWTSATALPAGWKIFERTGSLALCYVPTGTMISVK